MDEPLADTSIIPMFYLCKFAKEYVTVTLSGDGADEIFLGYETYIADKLKKYLDFFPRQFKSFFFDIAKNYFPVSHKKISFDYKLKQFLSGCILSKNEAHYWWRNIFSENLKKKFLLMVLKEILMIHLKNFHPYSLKSKPVIFLIKPPTWILKHG